jgi:hypothetical protein
MSFRFNRLRDHARLRLESVRIVCLEAAYGCTVWLEILKMLTREKLTMAFVFSILASSATADEFVYVVSGVGPTGQFGTVNLTNGTFRHISDTPESDANLVPGPNGTLYSLGTATGSLVSINQNTGATTVIGLTGLGSNAFSLGGVNGKLYLTDFSNNFYSVDPATGAAHLIGATGIPADPAVPFTTNPDGSLNLCDETLYAVGNKLYATFDAFKIYPTASNDPSAPKITQEVDPALWQIDPATGKATQVAPTALNLGASFALDGTFDAFESAAVKFTDQDFAPETSTTLVSLDLGNGGTKFLTNVDPAAGLIFGATPVPEPAPVAFATFGVLTILLRKRWQQRSNL